MLHCHDPAITNEIRACRAGDTRMRGVYRHHDGTIDGVIDDGVFRG